MMKLIIDFKNDESGAVTVDWVVLTAAIVGIGLSVITVISGGVQSATEEIDGGLQVASKFKFSFSNSITTMEDFFNEYIADGGDLDDPYNTMDALYSAADNASPDGYYYTGYVDIATDTPIYVSESEETFSVGGETVAVNEYDFDANAMDQGVYLLGGEDPGVPYRT